MNGSRKLLVLVLGLGLITAAIFAQSGREQEGRSGKPPQHKVVFELTNDNPESWGALLNNVENLQKAMGAPETQIEVVAHGKGLGMMLKKDSALTERIQKSAETGVIYAACENTMHRQSIRKEDLLPVVQTVDSGVAEVVRKQEAGWSYLKSGS